MRRLHLLAGIATLALGLVALQPAARANVIQVFSGQSLSATPITFALGTGSFSFTLDNTGFFPMSNVATAGTGKVSTFFGGVTDFESGSAIDGTGLYNFASYPSPASIPNSSALDFVGLSYAAADGTHYGFAEVFGGQFVGYAYETTSNTSIQTNELKQPVPEPASAELLIAGLTIVGIGRSKLKARRQAAV